MISEKKFFNKIIQILSLRYYRFVWIRMIKNDFSFVKISC